MKMNIYQNITLVVLLINIFVSHVFGVGVSYSDEDIKIEVTRKCVVAEECEFYVKMINLQNANILPIDKKILFEELKKQNCGWKNDTVAMGNSNMI